MVLTIPSTGAPRVAWPATPAQGQPSCGDLVFDSEARHAAELRAQRLGMNGRSGVQLWWSGAAVTLVLLIPGLLLWGLDGFRPPPGIESISTAGLVVLVVNYVLISMTFAVIGAL